MLTQLEDVMTRNCPNHTQLCRLCDHFCPVTNECQAVPGLTTQSFQLAYCKLAAIGGFHIDIMYPNSITVETIDGNVQDLSKKSLSSPEEAAVILNQMRVIRPR